MDNFFMRIALQEAACGLQEGEIPVGAVIEKEGKVVAVAHNLRERLKDPTAHAEILAIREAARHIGDWRLEGVSLYVTLEPCLMCVGAIIEARIRRVVFGAFDDRRGAVASAFDILRNEAVVPYRIEVRGGVLEEESKELLRAFFNMMRSGGRDGRVD